MRRATGRPLVLVAGAMANKAGNGGEAWVRLSWVRAFEDLGAEVAFVERLGAGIDQPAERDRAIRWFSDVTAAAGLVGRAWLVDRDRATADPHDVVVGNASELRWHLAHADVLVDISGNLARWEPADAIECRVHVDLDPGYTQVWAETGLVDLDWHHVHATVGLSVGSKPCAFPTDGRRWIPLLPPVHLPDWPHVDAPGDGAFTTVTSWRGPYGPLEWAGRTFGVKAHRFRAVAPLGTAVGVPLELAVRIDPADGRDLELLGTHGWRVVDPSLVAGTPEDFARYVQSSLGEFSIASPVYTEGRTGWFSDRTVRYLASGRPAVVEDTGWSDHLPAGVGLLSFVDERTAADALDTVLDDLGRHGRTARELAADLFTPRAALGPLLDAVGWPS